MDLETAHGDDSQLSKSVCFIGNKWGLLTILCIGNHENLRYGGIKQKLEGITPKALADVLRLLEDKGIVEKKYFNEIPPHTEYNLSMRGKDLYTALMPLVKWLLDSNDGLNLMILKQTLSKFPTARHAQNAGALLDNKRESGKTPARIFAFLLGMLILVSNTFSNVPIAIQ